MLSLFFSFLLFFGQFLVYSSGLYLEASESFSFKIKHEGVCTKFGLRLSIDHTTFSILLSDIEGSFIPREPGLRNLASRSDAADRLKVPT